MRRRLVRVRHADRVMLVVVGMVETGCNARFLSAAVGRRLAVVTVCVEFAVRGYHVGVVERVVLVG